MSWRREASSSTDPYLVAHRLPIDAQLFGCEPDERSIGSRPDGYTLPEKRVTKNKYQLKETD